MIGNKLRRFLKSRLFSALLNLSTIILFLIAYIIAKNKSPTLVGYSSILLLIFGLINSISMILISTEKGFKIKSKKKILKLDERALMLISGIIFLILSYLHHYLNYSELQLSFWEMYVSNLWISSAILMIITGIQTLFVHKL